MLGRDAPCFDPFFRKVQGLKHPFQESRLLTCPARVSVFNFLTKSSNIGSSLASVP